jgi:hypothetical protein
MAQYSAYRRQPIPQQYEQQLRVVTLPAPTRGLVLNENEAYMNPGASLVQDNWFPTVRGCKLRGGYIRHCDLHALDATVPPVPDLSRLPVISAFEYVDGNTTKMFAANASKLFDVTASPPVLIRSGRTSGNYCFAQMANAAGNWGIAANESGDPLLRYKSPANTWVTLGSGAPGDGASDITGATGLSYVWKYRNRLFFIQHGTMNAWYLGIDAVGGPLSQITLSGAAKRGGSLIAGFSWSLDAGDGINEKCCFLTDLGELLIFIGTNPGDPSNWQQQGRYQLSAPMGMNAHIQKGGDVYILTVEGVVPVSQAINMDPGQLELAMLSRPIHDMWMDESNSKRSWAWTVRRWDEQDLMLITWPGGPPGNRYCAVVHTTTGAWARAFGYDATCFIRMGADLFFGTQDGIVMQANRTGYDDGLPYVCTLVGGWEMFGAPANQIHWRQARAVFRSGASEPFQPQLAATVDYRIVIPPAPPAGPDPGIAEVWDEGLWDVAHWDAPAPPRLAPVRNTLWVSIGETGYAHAPIVQVTVGQQARPNVELIALAAAYEPAGVNV